jgi:hypothetical protein
MQSDVLDLNWARTAKGEPRLTTGGGAEVTIQDLVWPQSPSPLA